MLKLFPKNKYAERTKSGIFRTIQSLTLTKPTSFEWFMNAPQWQKPNVLMNYVIKEPDLANSLVAVLQRFRRWLMPIVADIEAMFYQVHVFPPDRDALRSFWWTEGNLDFKPTIYRMAVHLFGAKSSPSCATFCLRATARQFGKHFDPDVIETVMKSFYVDDCLTGTNTEEAAIKMISDLRSLLAMGGFKLTKLLSSSSKVIQTVPEEERLKSLQNSMPLNGPRGRILKINWNVSFDQFFFKVDLPDAPITKRGILGVTNSFYDPLRFVSPVVLLARLIYNKICQDKLGWDEPIKEPHLKR